MARDDGPTTILTASEYFHVMGVVANTATESDIALINMKLDGILTLEDEHSNGSMEHREKGEP